MIHEEKVVSWLKKGAKLSDSARALLKGKGLLKPVPAKE